MNEESGLNLKPIYQNPALESDRAPRKFNSNFIYSSIAARGRVPAWDWPPNFV
jgi:hypothetical protein